MTPLSSFCFYFALKELKTEERTVADEIADLPSDVMKGPELAISAISKFCPKTP